MHTRAGDSAAWPPSPVAAVAVLLDAGADAHTPTFKDTRLPLVCRGSTPLHIAAALGYEAVCVTLLSRTERSALGTAADPRLACNRWGLTPVDIALLASRHHLAHLLSPPRSTRSAQQQLVPPASSRVHGTAGYLLGRGGVTGGLDDLDIMPITKSSLTGGYDLTATLGYGFTLTEGVTDGRVVKFINP